MASYQCLSFSRIKSPLVPPISLVTKTDDLLCIFTHDGRKNNIKNYIEPSFTSPVRNSFRVLSPHRPTLTKISED